MKQTLYVLFLFLCLHAESQLFAEYNLYDRNKYHYDFPLKRNGRVVNPQPEEPSQQQFPPGGRYECEECDCYDDAPYAD